MATVAVFDSGLGSLSIVNAIRDISRCDIIYYADTRSHPYGAKSVGELSGIVRTTLDGLRGMFAPDLVVVGSNTPTLLLDGMEDAGTIGVWPPLSEAASASRTGRIAVLATSAVVESGAVDRYAASCGLPGRVRVRGVDASKLVSLVETGTFLRNPERCRVVIRGVLRHTGDADVCTLSSTHLPFIREMLEGERPGTVFLDPAGSVARRVVEMVGGDGGGTLRIFASETGRIVENLRMLDVREDVSMLDLAPSGSRG